VQLREQFMLANRKSRVTAPGVRSILISAGGADGRGFALQFMEAVRKLPFECAVTVMAGPAYRDTLRLKEAAQSMSGRIRFSVVENAPNMADYLTSADLALITGGTIMFESAACGTPAVIACSYENQVPQAEWFHQHKVAVNRGYFPDIVDRDYIARTIQALSLDMERRRLMSSARNVLVDGGGLNRFVNIVTSRLLNRE
jgi:spore coat polysaccharide biosynthesis predicted glycosyltransferase SpsG